MKGFLHYGMVAVNRHARPFVNRLMRLSALVVFLCLFSVSSASGQQQDRQVWVRVEDPSGATIPGAQVVVLSGSDVLGEFTADPRGLALISLGQAKEIKLIVSAAGFATTERDVAVPGRPPQLIAVPLALANVQDEVSVTATQDET